MLDHSHITEQEFPKAAKGLLDNARRMLVGGFVQESRQALQMLLDPGPWTLRRHGSLRDELGDLLPRVCWLCGEPSPKVGTQEAMTREELAEWAAEESSQRRSMLKMPVRNQLKPAGARWSEAYFTQLAQEKRFSKLQNEFLIDAEFVLKARLAAAAPGPKTAHTMDSLLKAVMEGGPLPDPENFNILDVLGQSGTIQVDPAAEKISTARILEVAHALMEPVGQERPDTEHFLFEALMQLFLLEGKTEQATRAACALASDQMGLSRLGFAASDKLVGALFASGTCAMGLGIGKAAVTEYLAALRNRPMPALPPLGQAPAPAGDTLTSFRALFANTPLETREWAEISVPDSDESVYAVEVSIREAESIWKLARAKLEETRRWPVLTTLWSGESESFVQRTKEADLFSRFYFNEVADADDVSPSALIAASKVANVDAFLVKKAERMREEFEFEEELEYQLEDTETRSGAAPSEAEVKAALKRAPEKGLNIGTYRLEKILLDWEQAHGGSGNPEDALQDWFEPSNLALLFLPGRSGWDALAYVNFYGTSDFGTENYIALGKRWEQRFGAELYAHFGTMLQCHVTRPPADLDTAFGLAVEHDLAAPCTLAKPGIALRHYATALRQADRWFLHERP